MPQPIVYDRDAGLRQGISQAGGALAGALQQRAEQEKYKQGGTILQDIFSKLPPNAGINEFQGAMAEAIQQGVPQQQIKMFSDAYAPQIKAQTMATTSQNIRNRYEPIKDSKTEPSTSSPQANVDDQQNIVEESQVDIQEQPLSAIDQARAFKPVEIAEGQETITTPAGTFSVDEFIETPYGRYHPNQIKEMNNSPNPADQREAQLVNQSLSNQEQLKGKEAIQIRKEWREKIGKFSEKYEDTPKYKNTLRKLDRAKDLIASGKVSLDDNWMRNAIIASTSDKGLESVSELAKTSEQRELYSIIYEFLNTKGLGGSNPSTKEVMLSLAAKPSLLKGDAENIRILNQISREVHSDLSKGLASNEIRGRAGPISYGRFLNEVYEKSDDYMKNIDQTLTKENQLYSAKAAIKNKPAKSGFTWMVTPDGKVAEIPNKEIKRAENAGGRRINGK